MEPITTNTKEKQILKVKDIPRIIFVLMWILFGVLMFIYVLDLISKDVYFYFQNEGIRLVTIGKASTSVYRKSPLRDVLLLITYIGLFSIICYFRYNIDLNKRMCQFQKRVWSYRNDLRVWLNYTLKPILTKE